MSQASQTVIAVAFVAFMTFGARAADDWKAADGPLKTRWAKDVSPEKALPEYPRPQMVRKEWTNLNGLWDYAIAPKAEDAPKAYQGKILVPYPVESALSGVMKMVGGENRLWYRRAFERPANSADKRVLLHLGAVDWEATVWVNGKQVGIHRGGYDPFSFDITDALKAEGAQEVVVAVWDPTNDGPQPRGKQVKKPGGIFYTPVTGIWQTVWLEAVPTDYIRSLKITPTLDSVTVAIDGGGANANSEVSVYDGDRQVASVTGAMTSTIKLAEAKLWTPENPHLYRLVVRAGGDSVESYFGLRTIEVKKDDQGVNRIYLNGQPIFMAGPLDQGFWPDGIYTAATDEALRYDIEITKKLGFNCTRKHVKVEPARWYYWCDKLGLLVWQDMPSGDRSIGPNRGQITRTPESAKIYETELKAMIDALQNHPSIVMWVVFNEGWGQFDTVRIAGWTKQYDPTRLVNPASGWNDFPGGDVIDMHKYPSPGAPAAQPNRAGVLGEFGGLGLPVEGHMWSGRNWGYRGVPDGKALTRQYVKMLSQAWAMRESAGLNAAIYTQITDVETEANGLLSYDREVIKVDVDAVAQASRGQAPPPPEYRQVVPTAEKEAIAWRYTTDKPGDDWFKGEFDASKWKEGPAGFGTEGTPGAVVRTEWRTGDIWMRREVALPAGELKSPLLMLHHDEDAEVYVNGVLAARVRGFTTAYEEYDLSAEARAALKMGAANVIAVHCHQTGGGQYIDVGIVDVK
jgi:hypothetical protein